MSDEFEHVRENFAKEIGEKIPPRDSKGQYIVETASPERLFAEREIEGESDDGGDDPRLRAREREVADGRIDERDGRKSTQNRQDVRRPPADAEDSGADDDGEADLATTEGDREGEGDQEPDEGPKYQVTVEGEQREITLNEALLGYVRKETFAKYVQQLQNVKMQLEQYDSQLRVNWAAWDKAKAEFEEDVRNMLPEMDWDAEFSRDPAAAHFRLKNVQAVHTRLAQSQAARAERYAAEARERDRQVENYAVSGFAKFLAENKIPEDQVQKETESMRRTALATGFSEYEVATTYDPRMLTVLRKASKYDRMMASRPRAIVPGKGRTVPPGSAARVSADRTRSSLDEAQRQLARTGRVEDAAKVFEKLF